MNTVDIDYKSTLYKGTGFKAQKIHHSKCNAALKVARFWLPSVSPISNFSVNSFPSPVK